MFVDMNGAGPGTVGMGRPGGHVGTSARLVARPLLLPSRAGGRREDEFEADRRSAARDQENRTADGPINKYTSVYYYSSYAY